MRESLPGAVRLKSGDKLSPEDLGDPVLYPDYSVANTMDAHERSDEAISWESTKTAESYASRNVRSSGDAIAFI